MRKRYNKRILVITHQLSRTGAPIVLLEVIQLCRKQGYDIDVITMLDGELRQNLEEMNISVQVQEQFLGQADAFYQYASKYDMVIANTLITYEVIHILNHSQIPVLWWLHEGKQYFEYFAKVLPDFNNLAPNVHVFSVGHYVQKVIEDLYGCQTEILHFGVEDVPRSKPANNNAKVQFLTAGTYSKVKAQDVLAEAIRLLPEEYLKRAEFYFCGNQNQYDETVYAPVKQISEEYENVTMLPLLSHPETLKWMEECDCLIVPSRIDPIPTVAVEIMMKENICLCTDVCGVAHYIADGVNGFTVPPEDAKALAEKIEYIIDNKDNLDSVKAEGRKVYENYFSKAVFEPHVLKLIEAYTHPKEREMTELSGYIMEIERQKAGGLQLPDSQQQELDNTINIVNEYIKANYETDGIEESNDRILLINKFLGSGDK